MDFRFRWKSGRAADITALTEVDSERILMEHNPPRGVPLAA